MDEFDLPAFTHADWNLIADLLREKSKYIKWRSMRPGISISQCEELEAAAERHFRLAGLCILAKQFCKTEVSDET